MKNLFAFALLLCTLFAASCTKTEDTAPIDVLPVDGTNTTTATGVKGPVATDAARIIIHFGTSTQQGCMYSFSNCIWIGWGTGATAFDRHMALTFDQGEQAGQYFGHYFPLTADYTVDAATSKALGIPEQVIPAGFYPVREAGSGQATGRRMVVFTPEPGLQTTPLVNPSNPQDNIGQIHNLAAQVILNDQHETLAKLRGDSKALQQFLTEKTVQFLNEAQLPVNAETQRRAYALNLDGDYSKPGALLDGVRLTERDGNALRAIFDEAASIPVTSPESLGKFLSVVTTHETRLAKTTLDNPQLVLGALSILKYSRYYWFWKGYTTGTSDVAGTASANRLPAWVVADVKEWLNNGDLVSTIVASVKVYLQTR